MIFFNLLFRQLLIIQTKVDINFSLPFLHEFKLSFDDFLKDDDSYYVAETYKLFFVGNLSLVL